MASDYHARIRDMRMHFLVPPSEEQIFAEFDTAFASLPSVYRSAANALRHSISSALSTVAMPFQLANAGVARSHYQRFRIAEAIRFDDATVPTGEDLETVRAREAGEKAAVRMTEFLQSEDGRKLIIRDICDFLLASLERANGIENAARELILQGLVLLWSAFEVLFRDTFETLLNQEPDRVKNLMTHSITRKRFDAERLPLDVLVRHGFDLSARLGSVLVGQQDFSDLPTIKAVYSVLFPVEGELHNALGQQGLWNLYQCRHLVVHRRGIIDQAYLDATGDTDPLGTQLVVTPHGLEDLLVVVVSCSTELVRSLLAK